MVVCNFLSQCRSITWPADSPAKARYGRCPGTLQCRSITWPADSPARGTPTWSVSSLLGVGRSLGRRIRRRPALIVSPFPLLTCRSITWPADSPAPIVCARCCNTIRVGRSLGRRIRRRRSETPRRQPSRRVGRSLGRRIRRQEHKKRRV